MIENDNVILKVKNLKQYFRNGTGKKKVTVKAVDDVSFEVKKGEVFGLVGESGCGKTTTGRAIIKLYNINDGKIYFKDQLISSGITGYKEEIKRLKTEFKEASIKLKAEEINDQLSELKTKINRKIATLKEKIRKAKCDNVPDMELMTKMQMIFQDPIASLNPRMTVKEIIAEGLRINNVKDNKLITKKVDEVLEVVGLVKEHASRYPHEFSGGQRQRIGVARALIVNPELIIADEPISALDVSIQAQVINLLNDLREELGLTILFIAHDLSVVKYFSDRIAVMYYGKIVELSSTDELFKNPLHPYTRSLLSAVPQPDPDSEKERVREIYDPSMHDYSNEQPKMVEISPEHYVLGSTSEIKEYKKILK